MDTVLVCIKMVKQHLYQKRHQKNESVLVGEIRVTETHFKIDDFEDEMIYRYIISLKIINKYRNDSYN